jgi:hypothetical protein
MYLDGAGFGTVGLPEAGGAEADEEGFAFLLSFGPGPAGLKQTWLLGVWERTLVPRDIGSA